MNKCTRTVHSDYVEIAGYCDGRHAITFYVGEDGRVTMGIKGLQVVNANELEEAVIEITSSKEGK